MGRRCSASSNRVTHVGAGPIEAELNVLQTAPFTASPNVGNRVTRCNCEIFGLGASAAADAPTFNHAQFCNMFKDVCINIENLCKDSPLQ